MKALLIVLMSVSLMNADLIRIGYDSSSMSNYSRKDMKVATDLWLNTLMGDLGHTMHFRYYDNPKEMAEDIANDKLDFVSGFPLVFVKYFDMSKLSAGFSGGLKKPEEGNYVVLVPKDSSVKSWKDLGKATFCIQEHDNAAKLYLKHQLLKETGSEHAEIMDIKSRQRAIIQLFFGKTDAAIVTKKSFNLAAELNPQIRRKIRVLENTGVQSMGVGFFRKNLDPKIKKVMMKAALKLGDDPRGKQMLLVYKTENIVMCKTEDLKPVEKLYKDYILLKGKKNSK